MNVSVSCDEREHMPIYSFVSLSHSLSLFYYQDSRWKEIHI